MAGNSERKAFTGNYKSVVVEVPAFVLIRNFRTKSVYGNVTYDKLSEKFKISRAVICKKYSFALKEIEIKQFLL